VVDVLTFCCFLSIVKNPFVNSNGYDLAATATAR
jgi:hypothetical protein